MNDLVFLCVWNQDDPIDFGNLFIETETAINENAKSALPTKRFRFHRSQIHSAIHLGVICISKTITELQNYEESYQEITNFFFLNY